MGDPFDLAWAEGHGASDLPGAGPANHDGDDEVDEVRSDGSEDDCLFRDDPGDDFAEEILEGLQEEHGLPSMEDDENQGEDEEDDQEEVEHAEATEAELIAAAIAACDDSSASGYIACPIPPWNFKQCIARITCWPTHSPPAQQSLACRCYMHASCSITRKRLAFPKEQYFQWIFSMKPLPPDATAAQKEAAKHEHMFIKGAEFLPKKQAA
jgi:hypothetical protein